MESRIGQNKPNPQMKKNAIRARHKAKNSKRAQGFVVAASMAVTILGWALFSHQDAADQAAAQATDDTTAIVSVQTSDSGTPTPIITNLQTSNAGGSTN